MKKYTRLFTLPIALCLLLSACSISVNINETTTVNSNELIDSAKDYNSEAYTELNGNKPSFTDEEITTESFEEYGRLDYLGRCTAATACVGKDLMPTEKRGAIGMVKPTGWQTVKYDDVDGRFLYNRCHLIAYMLTAENANTRNLITGTRYMNTEGMLPFETEVCDYVKRTNNHVMYRVTPIFKDEELVARGVQMEAYSVEDNGKGVSFNVYCYNVQPNIEIDYKTGKSRRTDRATIKGTTSEAASEEYIVNTNTKKFHKTTCSLAKDIKDKNKDTYKCSRNELISKGYKPCGSCKP